MTLPVSDRELLELAAKANGYLVKGWVNDRLVFFNPVTCSAEETWNPLTDHGDALRLAVKIRATLICARTHTACDVPGTDEWVSVEAIDDAAACRVIVLAAAAVGRAMP